MGNVQDSLHEVKGHVVNGSFPSQSQMMQVEKLGKDAEGSGGLQGLQEK